MATLLVVTVLLPLLGGLGLLLAPRLDHTAARWVALGTTLVTLAFSLVLVAAFQIDDAGVQFAFRGSDGSLGIPWVSVGAGSGIRFALGLDGIALSLFALTTLLLVTSVFSSWSSIVARAPAYYALLLFLETGLLGLFASLDVVLFYIFFEFTLIPLFFIVGIYGGPERRRASITFFLYTLAGSLLTLLGVIALVVVHHSNAAPQVLTFSIPELTEGLSQLRWPEWSDTRSLVGSVSFPAFLLQPQVLIFLLLFAGFAIKVPLFPFHTWLPLAHVEAPTAGSVLLAGVLLKVGGYGFLRFNLGMVPGGAAVLAPFLVTIAVIGIIYGALTALAQSDVKRLVAYSSVSHMGFIALGLFSMTLVSVDGAVLQMINHGLTTGALFACVGILYERYHTREMGRMGGVWERLPLFAFLLILASLGSAAVPGLNGFVGEFPILAGTYSRFPSAAVIGALGIILGAYYLFVMLQKVVFGPLVEPVVDDHGQHAEVPPIRWYEIAGLTPLLVLIVLIGIYPKPFYDRITPSVESIVARFPDADADPITEPIQTVSDPGEGVTPRALLAAPAQVIAP
ncbi:complex I subunit 4 family protein [Tautonia plasticadhaerens]|uniref:NADH-quinone oxidoreductase subunit M n=1 Tax=Tautonia plasticadhaerens TaxID=2527974 RepID=A0A518H8P9_9BACT|nr:NADH-quinone oxidoreductase subunit M [Tautonia plasticadhaerens]QDV37146.1 NADH-quinone oxidoreductase subunit M [Tautonia plasticadhaerens]